MLLFLRVARSPADSPLRRSTFHGDSLILQENVFVRRRGRPRQTWARELFNEGLRLFGRAAFEEMLTDTSEGAALESERRLRARLLVD